MQRAGFYRVHSKQPYDTDRKTKTQFVSAKYRFAAFLAKKENAEIIDSE
jgi:hypothetical protein